MLLRAALSALLLSLMAIGGARAADLSGGCCADLEERVAELEATTATKGNRKVTVIIYGQVDKAFLYENASIGSFKGVAPKSQPPSQRGIVDNSNAPTIIGAMGEGKIDKNWKAGFKLEIEFDSREFGRPPGLTTFNQAPATIRTATVWTEVPVGKLTLGHGSVASDGTGQLSVANAQVASKMLSLGPAGVIMLGFDLPFNDVRRDMARYDSPTILGFLTISGSMINGDTANPFTFLTPVATTPFAQQKTAWDIAARAAYEFKGGGDVRVAAAISYRNEGGALFITPLPEDAVLQGSVSVMHVATGAFVNFGYGHVTGIGSSFLSPGLDLTMDMWQVQGGWEKNIFKIGTTTLFAEYGNISFSGTPGSAAGTKALFINGNENTNLWGLGAVQALDQLALDLYADYRHYDVGAINGCAASKPGCGPVALTPDLTGDVFMAGMRIKF